MSFQRIAPSHQPLQPYTLAPRESHRRGEPKYVCVCMCGGESARERESEREREREREREPQWWEEAQRRNGVDGEEQERESDDHFYQGC